MEEEFKTLIEKSLTSSVEELTVDVKRLITSLNGYTRSMWENFEVEGLHRARKHNHVEGKCYEGGLYKFMCECEFWNPPSVYATMGRCNAEGESLLYCATDFTTSVYECKPEIGDFVSVAFFNRKSFPSDSLQHSYSRVIPIGVDYLVNIPILKKMFRNYDFNGRSDDFKRFDGWMDTLFYQDIDESPIREQHYKLTTAIKNALMVNLQYGQVERVMHGILYSSIMRNHKGFNLVLRPTHARTIFNLVRIRTYEVVGKSNDEIVLQHKRSGVVLPQVKSHPLDFQSIYWLNEVDDGERKVLKNSLT